MKWAITGAGGYIGAHLLKDLIECGDEVLALTGNSLASQRRLAFLKTRGESLDLFDSRDLTLRLKKFQPDVVVHLASLKSPEESNRYPDQYIKHNFGVLQNVFQAAKSAGAKTFINASSSAIYGNLDSESIAESDLGEPISAYGLSKKMGEEFLYSFETRDMQICSLRLFNVIGSAHYSLAESALFHLVPATISRIKSGKRPVIFGFKLPTRDGTALRDYLHVSDVVMVFQKVAALLDHQTFRGHLVVNIGSGQGRSVLEVVNMIQKKLNSNFEPIFEKSRDGDPVSAVANINRSQNIFGFSPLYTFEQMIESCVQS